MPTAPYHCYVRFKSAPYHPLPGEGRGHHRAVMLRSQGHHIYLRRGIRGYHKTYTGISHTRGYHKTSPIPGQKQGHHNIFGNCRDITKNVYFMPGEGQGYHLWSCFMFGDIQERFIELMKKASHSFHFLHVTHQKVTNSDLKNQ